MHANDDPSPPQPTVEEQARSQALSELIQQRIEDSGGGISFAEFMEMSLYSPGLGYYSSPGTKFGEAGDFTTAPEISPQFGACVARQAAQVLAHLQGSGAPASVLEVGAGSGALASQVLLELERLGHLPQRYQILEVSADLRARQHQTLEQLAPALLPQVEWLDGLPASGFRGVVLANELLDALPVHRLCLQAEITEEWYVAWQAGFTWRKGPAGAGLEKHADWVRQHWQGDPEIAYSTEVSPARNAWLGSISAMLETGLILLSDYGYPAREYYHAQRTGGTLQAHYRHRAHAAVLDQPGLQDLTAHVDFTVLAETALDCDLQVAGFTTQAQFLLATGLMEQLPDSDLDPRRVEQLNQIKRLTLPGQMGEIFKFMALARGLDIPLLGFYSNDQRHRL